MQIKIEVNNTAEFYSIDEVAKQAAGSVLLRVKDTVILAAVARDDTPVEEDFLPLTVQYVEKQYAAGRIPGGYIKRETKPGDFETLTSRIIDRSLRPLFPKGYAYPTQITVMVLSCDESVDLQTAALNAASAALYLSDIPLNKPVCGVRVGRIDGEFIINPSNEQLKNSTLDLYVAGAGDELLMIEMRALASEDSDAIPIMAIDALSTPAIAGELQKMNELSESETLEAIKMASEAILRGSNAYNEAFSDYKKPLAKLNLKSERDSEIIDDYISKNYLSEIKHAINKMAKSERAGELNALISQIAADSVATSWEEEDIAHSLNKLKKRVVREQIINDGIRADGRGLKEVRAINIATNILPRAHGSCLFTRGQTQALVVATLGGDNDAQLSESLIQKGSVSDRFMFNYNFPGFSVGEAAPMKAPGRRELGHGNLAKRALAPSVPLNLPQTIRLVSEILESNGSSSMASVCGGSLALRAAGVQTTELVAGVAMGLIFEGDKHAVLTDIMGLEDHDGDMDFKVAGPKCGITALQMDIKLGGISLEVLKEALMQAKEAREHILGLMEAAAENIELNEEILPKLDIFSVDPGKIVDIIGQAGKTIKEIIDRFSVSIDLDREKGEVKIAGDKRVNVDGAKDYIIQITQKPSGFRGKKEERDLSGFKVGDEFSGEVKKNAPFGAFIGLKDGVDGLLHISKIKGGLAEGSTVRVKIAEIKNGKISLELC